MPTSRAQSMRTLNLICAVEGSAYFSRCPRVASTPQDGTSATCAEDLFTNCISRRARGRRCAYLIVWSESAAAHATADDHGFDLANYRGIAAPGARVSGQRRRLRKTAGELDAPRCKERRGGNGARF